MRAKIIATPHQKKVIERKLKEAKQLRIIKTIAYNDKLSNIQKTNMITNLIK
jgi:hypothetical protein